MLIAVAIGACVNATRVDCLPAAEPSDSCAVRPAFQLAAAGSGHMRDSKMSTPKILLSFRGRGVVLASIAALVLTMTEPPLAVAAPVSKGVSATASSGSTDFSAARRHRHYRRGGGNAAGLAFMGLAIGTIGAIAAQQRRDGYYNNGYYNNGYGYAPGYYGGGPYYGRRYYRY
jgi:hypothetical protein